ncbi:MAG: enoyl-CoA hydratase/isomerase family protein [Gammaproteobacteria bacterium]|nr:enoyl-CoA hydratase/isomerase family protein [Gammaproteobacteria bacterium]
MAVSEILLTDKDERGVATLTLNRPDVHNAFDDKLIEALRSALLDCDRDSQVRVIILTGRGKSFSSGADLNWMRAMASFSEEENIEDALHLAELMAVLNGIRKPTLAKVNGHAFGGGVGLVACCDIAVGADTTRFALSEVRLGLVPAVISPYVMSAIGERQARRYFLTGEAFDAITAREIGLLHTVASRDQLDSETETIVAALLAGGPEAQLACKNLVANISHHGVTASHALRQRTAELIAQLRGSDEGQEGLAAFLEKRKPGWQD